MDEEGRTRAVSQVEQMRASQCYERSQGKLGCTSCHDPHGKPADAERIAFYQARCNACHDQKPCTLPEEERARAPAAGSCIHCHMPPLAAGDVPHTAQADHRLLRQPAGSPAPHAKEGEYDVFDGAMDRLPPREVNRARALAIVSRPEILRSPRLARQVQSLLLPPNETRSPEESLDELGDDDAALVALGVGFSASGKEELAQLCWVRALKINPENEVALTHLVLSVHDQGNMLVARQFMERLLALNPYNSTIQGRYTHVLGQTGEVQAGIRAAQTGLELNPLLIPIREWLVEVYQKEGENAKSQEQREIIERLQEAGAPP
jgi:tetratricopeptide (TPR) repeat protein